MQLLARGGIELSIEWDTKLKALSLSLLSLQKNCSVTIALPEYVTTVDGVSLDKKNQFII